MGHERLSMMRLDGSISSLNHALSSKAWSAFRPKTGSHFSERALEFPQKWIRFCGQKMLQLFELELFLYDLIDSIGSERALAECNLTGL